MMVWAMLVVVTGNRWLLADTDAQVLVAGSLHKGPYCCILWVVSAPKDMVEIAPCTGEKADTFVEAADAWANEEKDPSAALVMVEGDMKPVAEAVESGAHHDHDEEAD